MRRLLSRRRRDERGYTVTELMVATMIMGVVAAIATTGLTSIVQTTAGTEVRAVTTGEVRTALERIVRDLRAANPLDVQTTVSDYETRLSFSVYCATPGVQGCTSGHLRPIVYRLNGTRLEQTVGGVTTVLVGPKGPASLPEAAQPGAIVNPAGAPVFSYYDEDNAVLATSGAGAPSPATFRDCARSVEAHLVVRAAPQSSATIDLRTRGTLRNFHEVTGC